MSNNYYERKEIFDAYTKLSDKVKECRDIIQNETLLLVEDTIKEWNEVSLDVIGELACLRIKTKALLQKSVKGKSHEG